MPSGDHRQSNSTTSAYGIDIGIYRLGKQGQVLTATTFAWARNDGSSSLVYEDGNYRAEGKVTGGTDVRDLANHIRRDIGAGHQIAIGIEAPMWQPSPIAIDAPGFDLFPIRFEAERGYAWYLQSGASALVRGLSTGRLVLSLVGEALNEKKFSTHNRQADIFLYEGFAAGRWKILTEGSSHIADAFTTATAFHLTNDPKAKAIATIHDGGSANGVVLSHWQTIVTSLGWDGSDCMKDCLVVGLDSECASTKEFFIDRSGESANETLCK